MSIWKFYEVPILLVALVNWLILFAFSDGPVYEAFWWILLFFSVITLLFSLLLEGCRRLRPVNFFSYFTIGKVLKFVLSIALLLGLSVFYPEMVVECCVTVGALFLVTLIVDTGVFLRFARSLKKEAV
ncbi:MAG: hypothetical protein RR346_05850 [Bacteroidales bacterium]